MAPVQPTSRIQISQDGDWTRIDVPARRNWLVIAFLALWTVGWGFGGFFAEEGSAGPPGDASGGLLAMVSSAMWLLFLGVGLFALLWTLLGRDSLWISEKIIARRVGVGPLARSFEFDVQHFTRAWWQSPTVQGGDNVASFVGLSYGPKEVKFGSGVDQTEGKIILDELTRITGIPQT